MTQTENEDKKRVLPPALTEEELKGMSSQALEELALGPVKLTDPTEPKKEDRPEGE